MQKLPLEGFRIIDCSTMLAGPLAATHLADFGADVIKVELPPRQPITRRPSVRLHEERNKRSVTLDLHYPEGREVLLRLVERADALVENFRPGTMERWGLGADVLLARNPRLIIHRLSAYGQTGPWREKVAYDRQAQAFAGATYVTGYPDAPPVRSGYAVADYIAGIWGAFSILLAAYWRDARGGEGQVSDLALFEPIFRASEAAITEYSMSGKIRERAGNRNPGVVPASNFLTADGVWLAVNANSDKQWKALARAIGREDLADDPAYLLPARLERADELYRLLEAWIAERTAAEVQEVLDRHSVPAAPVLNIADIARHPHYWERGTIEPVDAGPAGTVLMAGVLPKLSKTPGRIRWAGPLPGQHTDEVLREVAGLSPEEIAELRRKGIV
jgi:crotonobetainyl-CoA:carnitine CoA-transferase CaiB-like acyl-CoA transferase